MGILRLVAWILVALGLALVGADGVSTIEDKVPHIRTTSEIMGLIGIRILPDNDAVGAAARTANFFLNAPFWAIVGTLGIIMALTFRPIE